MARKYIPYEDLTLGFIQVNTADVADPPVCARCGKPLTDVGFYLDGQDEYVTFHVDCVKRALMAYVTIRRDGK